MPIEYLSKEDIENICHRLAVKYLDSPDDPIPPFSEHSPALLESALNLPRQTFDGKDLYPTLVHKAAILYYTLIKNHAFPNGNKRIATTTLLVFLFINDWWLQASADELADKTIAVAESDATTSELVLREIKVWIKDKITRV